MLTPNDKYKKIPVSLGFSISFDTELTVPEDYDEVTLNDKVQSIIGNLSCTSDVKISDIYVSDYWVVDNSLKDEDYQEDERRHNKELYDR